MGICRGHVSVGRRPSPGSANGRRYSAISSTERVRRMAFGRICSMKKLSRRTIASPASERSACKAGRIPNLSQWSQLCGPTIASMYAIPFRASRWRLAQSKPRAEPQSWMTDRKSTRLNSSHGYISYDVFCLKKRSDPDAAWHRVMEDSSSDPALLLLKKHLQGLGVRAVLFVPMLIAGRVTGIIGVRFPQNRAFQKDEIELTQALAHQAMLAIQLMRLSEQSRQAAVAAERKRMARDIHDTLAQGFTGGIVQSAAAGDATSKGLAKETEEHLRRAGDLARESLKEARRSVRALRPQALDEKNLCQALEDLLRKMTAGTTLPAEFNVQGQPRSLPPEWEENILRICQEVLTNALRHAHASQFKAQLLFVPSAVRLDLCDNGCGVDPAGKHDGFGLMGMRERLAGLGGNITIQSATGKGTAILIVLPIATDSIASAK